LQKHRSRVFTFQFFKKKLKPKSIYILWESCSTSYKKYNKIGFGIFRVFYDFISNLQNTAKTLKGVKNPFARRPLLTFESSQMCPRTSPPYHDGGGALAGGEVRIGEANKRARVAIRLTSDRLAVAVQAERGPAMTGGETAMVWPPQLGFRANADEARPSRVLGSSSGY
jgi:hypothetical protein